MNSLSQLFHAVKSGPSHTKVAFWGQCKTAAASDPGGPGAGLVKIALGVWADAYERGGDPGQDQLTREAFAASFGSAAVVDNMISKLAEEGKLSYDEQTCLRTWVAESAVQDLEELTKSAGAMDLLRKPQVIGALSGAVLGMGLGAWRDDENRGRGALAGVIPGALAGVLVGHQVAGGQASRAASKAMKSQSNQSMMADVVNVDDINKAVSQAMGPHISSAPPRMTPGMASDAALRARKGSTPGTVSWSGEGWSAHKPGNPVVDVHHPAGRMVRASLDEKLAGVMDSLAGGQPSMNADTAAQPQQLPPWAQQGQQGQEQAPQDPNADPAAQAGQAGQEQGLEHTDANNPEAQPEAIGDQPGIQDAALDDGLAKANKSVDNMIFLAKQVGLTPLAQELDAHRDQLAEHFSQGNEYLPPELQHHFAQSEHAEQFMKKYKQRFGKVSGGAKAPSMPKTGAFTFKSR